MRPSEYPRWIVLQLVEACNLRCRMCYEWGERGSYHRGGSAQLDYDVIRRVVHDCAPGRPCFELFGGEPFLHPRIADVIALIAKTGCVLGIPTNGTLLDRFTDALVGDAPIRLWLSVDGPEEVNDRQRGRGAFKLAVGGLESVHAARTARGCTYPQLGVTYIVTPLTAPHVSRFFLESIELATLDFVSIVLQNFATEAECAAYEQIVKREFAGSSAAHARGYVEKVEHFSGINKPHLADQIQRVRDACREARVLFFSNPMTTDAANLERYFGARWDELADRRSRCAFPWMYAEVSARGEVTTCHTFYDITAGNVHDEGILEIWNGNRIRNMRNYLRRDLFPICTACCRYYNNPISAVLAGLDPTPAAAPITTGSEQTRGQVESDCDG
jgi:radical SAM protein with 4Fe4S-binding SPASM domain